MTISCRKQIASANSIWLRPLFLIPIPWFNSTFIYTALFMHKMQHILCNPLNNSLKSKIKIIMMMVAMHWRSRWGSTILGNRPHQRVLQPMTRRGSTITIGLMRTERTPRHDHKAMVQSPLTIQHKTQERSSVICTPRNWPCLLKFVQLKQNN